MEQQKYSYEQRACDSTAGTSGGCTSRKAALRS